jgi:hypothetical protein
MNFITYPPSQSTVARVRCPVVGVDSHCRGCGWVFPLRLPEHGSVFVCPRCHRVCGEWGEN